MADIREERKAHAKKHNALMRGAFGSETQKCIEATIIYEEGEGRELELPNPAFETTETEVTTQFTVNSLYANPGKTAIAYPVTFGKPGGNYEDGAFGPEQILCSESNLYQVLCGLKGEYHDKNKGYARGMLFTDRALFIPEVTFSRDGNIRKADIIGMPEPNRQRALENNRSEREADTCLSQRIEAMLRIAAANECETLIVNAFGCNRQGFEPAQVISLFRKWVEEHQGAIKTIIFSVPRNLFDVFDEAFGQPKIEEVAPVVEAKEEDEDEFDLDNIELPEGVIFRR